ncbi:MAG: ABC transporter ATP-binding protein [Candidatus Korarchaeum sp.]|nr:ABC transporter ATP-binding protein [Candidatus Korarchaeum sp.]MDW8035392.1 ABC transporter ATP-binding protein [Candidatus Korarchaeum sp.]
MTDKLVEVENLYSGYGKLRILFCVNFYAKAGEITVIVGPNGAGKTTLLNSVMGMTTVYSGTVRFDGRDITKLPTYKRARMGLAYLPQYGNIAAGLTVEENLRMAGHLVGPDEVEERVYEVIELFPKLGELLPRKAGTLSGGERRMLAIGIALMRKPKVLLLDEMTTDLAPMLVNQVLSKVVELRDSLGQTVIMVEQNAKKALEIGDRAYLLVSGEIRFEGDPQDLLNNPQLSKLYLGIIR